MALISECTALARSWILVPNPLVVVCFFFLLTYLFALFPRSERLEKARILKKGFLARADLIFGKSQKSHEPSRVSIVDVPSTGCHCHQGKSVC